MSNAQEANFDGLVGLTHHYAGLSFGNVASQTHACHVAHPKTAAKQGLAKMQALADLGFPQGVLPPQERPSIRLLRALGFSGHDHQIIRQAAIEAPELLTVASSASSMWTANAATVSPSSDTRDGRVHFTPANLVSKLHRAIETPTTARALRALFASERHFVHHAPLPGAAALGDEGAANHTRFCADYGAAGVEWFVYGRRALGAHNAPQPERFPARQTLEASQAIARRHGLRPDAVVFAQQHPDAIDAGVFHNDVIAVGNQNILFCHEDAFLDQPEVYAQLRAALERHGAQLQIIEAPRAALSVQDAVSSYLFNSQLLTRADGRTLLVVPQECRENARVAAYLDQLTVQHSAIHEVKVFDVRESMRNGGGPACLRLRVVLTETEIAAVNPSVWINPSRFWQLENWIDRHYRDRLTIADLADPALLDECRTALDELTQLLNLKSIYDFQQE